jgi:hypothetical protein
MGCDKYKRPRPGLEIRLHENIAIISPCEQCGIIEQRGTGLELASSIQVMSPERLSRVFPSIQARPPTAP